ncbi:MAG: alpha/beta hydrolase [Candidatus Paceibacterota bacterium]
MKNLRSCSFYFITSFIARKYFLIVVVIIVFIATFFFSNKIFISAYFEHFFTNINTVDTTLGQLQNSDTPFIVSFTPLFTPNPDEVEPYGISPDSICNQYNEYWECIDQAPDLCPYIALAPEDGEVAEAGFIQSPNWRQATGELTTPTDETDNWNITIKSPCFEGECPVGYDEFQNGAPLAQSLKGQTFKCNLTVQSNKPPVLVKNIFGNNIAYADNPTNIIEVRAVFTGELPGCTVDCFSNVLFLPGLMGSRLYDQTGSVECGGVLIGPDCFKDEELWVSSSDLSHEKLALDNQGKSINNIYTKNDTQRLSGDGGETGIIDDVYIFNIYKSFINDLKKWKEDEKIIKDYAFIPYDWRLSLDDIINNGNVTTKDQLSYNQTQNFSESFILKKLEELQKSSKSGKVTIVAHSNGGLVAKALIQKLKDTNNPLYEKIDKVILIAVPQIGTPEAFINLLHGTDIGPAGLIMSNERSRQLAENMPAVYNLLPSASYFTTVDPAFAIDKIASFEDKPFFSSQISQYGVDISNEAKMKSYILGGDSRTSPLFNDTVHPNIGNSTLYDQAQSVHQMLDNWTTPYQDTKVIQVAGWGEETLAGLDYKSYINFLGNEKLSFKPRDVIDGDGTVVVPSALWMSDSNPNVERWWIDLKTYNEPFLGVNRTHKDILEVPNLLDFVKSKVKDTSFSDSDKIVVDNTSTLVSIDISRLHYILHSPLTLGVMDGQGRYTGMDPLTKQIKEEIPDVHYKKIGDVQFISIPDDIAHTVKMQGYEEGSFSLDIEKQEGNNISESSSLQGIPSSVSTVATIQVAPNAPVGDSILAIDQNGDGVVDKTLQAKVGEVVVYDVTPPELKVTFDLNTKKVVMSGEDKIDANPIISISKKLVTLTDKSNNITTIPLTKYKKEAKEFDISFKEINRNNINTKIPETRIEYSWKEKKGTIIDLDTKITIKNGKKYTFSYNKEKDMTMIKEKEYLNNRKDNDNEDDDNNNEGWKIIKKVKGFVSVVVATEGSGIKVDY